MPTTQTPDPAGFAHGTRFHVQRSVQGLILDFPVLRAIAPASSLIAFSLLCGVMPAIGLSALLPLQPGNASALVSLALIGGFAAPFMLASIIFAALAVYLLANSLHVEVSADGVRTERRVFGHVTRRGAIARTDLVDVEPRISARFQNVFSSTPRYALVATHRSERLSEVVIAEDLSGQALMLELRALVCAALKLN